MKQTFTIGWFVGTKFLRYILLSFHSIREYRDIGSFGTECLGGGIMEVCGFEAFIHCHENRIPLLVLCSIEQYFSVLLVHFPSAKNIQAPELL